MTEVVITNIYRYAKTNCIRIGDLEESIGVSKGYLSKCRSGKCVLSVDMVDRAAEALGVKKLMLFDDVYDEMEWQRADPDRPKSWRWICPKCKKDCYYVGRRCGYKFCPNCGKKIR